MDLTELAVISARLQRRYPGYESGSTYFVVPLSHVVLGDVSAALWTVFVAVLGILIIACAKVASMLLTSASSRDREFAVRSALGASRRRLAEQLLIETGALALLGGILGVALAYGILAALRPSLTILPHIETLSIDTAALLYGLGIVIVCTLLAGLWPIAAFRRGTYLQATLKAAGRSGTSPGGNRLRAGLVVTEIAVALALVVMSGLIVRSYFALVNADLGIRPHGVLVTNVMGLPSYQYHTLDARAAFERRLLQRLQEIPGVHSAALSVAYPLSNMSLMFQIGIVGRVFPTNQEPALSENTITPAYFQTLGIPILRGRAFSDSDTGASQPVAIVNQTFARSYGKNGNPLGMRITTPGWNGTPRATRVIVGVAADTRDGLQQPPREQFYVPLQQGPPDLLSAMVRTDPRASAGVAKAMQDAIAQTDTAMAAPQVQSFAGLIDQSSQQQRSIATLLAALAVVALLLALFGIFGVVSYGVSQRYGEFGIRAALGARSAIVLADVLGGALSMTALGVGIGIVLAFFGAHAVASQLYRVSPVDPVTFIGVVALIAVCSAIAALLPAIRAVRIDPAAALRYE